MKVLAMLAWYAAPVLYSAMMAYSVAAQTNLDEENRRIIERQQERIASVERTHDRDLNDIERRMDQIETWIFYLFLASGASPAIVGLDKAAYWTKRNRAPKSS